MSLHERLKSEYDSLETISENDGFVIKRMPISRTMQHLKFYRTEESYKNRKADYIGICFGIALDPSNGNNICYMNINHTWFNYISE